MTLQGDAKKGTILAYVDEYPGETFSDIRRALGIPITTFGFHIRKLEKETLILSKSYGNWKRFYPITMKDIPEPPLTPPTQNIYDMIAEYPGISYKGLVAKVGVSRQAIKFHIKKLLKMKAIRAKWEKGVRYVFYVKGNKI